MTENKSSSWCMKNTMDLEVPRGEAKFVLMCINLNYKNNSHANSLKQQSTDKHVAPL